MIAHILLRHIVSIVIEDVIVLVMELLLLFLHACFSLRCIAVEAVRFNLSKVQEARFVADLSMPVDIAVAVSNYLSETWSSE